MLADWGYDRLSMWMDLEDGTLSVGSDRVMTVRVSNGQLKLEYDNSGWEQSIENSRRSSPRKQILPTVVGSKNGLSSH